MSEKYYVSHECELTNNETRQVIYSKNIDSEFQNVWNLVLRRAADLHDLEENHFLESEGDIVWEATIEILFCPFCGIKLKESREFEGEVSLYHRASEWEGRYS